MQTENPQTDLFRDEFHIDETGKMHIRSLASWAMVVVITSVLGYVASILELFTSKEEYAPVEGFSSTFAFEGTNTGGSIFVIIIGLLINFFLYRFASQAKTAVGALNVEKLNNSFRNLKIYFVITSILMILVLLLLLLGMTSLLR
jgi:hypothetical protein